MIRTIKIFLFDDIELLDFAGPLEVFSVARYLQSSLGLDIATIAFSPVVKTSKTGLSIIPDQQDYTGLIDLLIIPGGIGTREIINNGEKLHRIDQLIKSAKHVASVCTGALILGKLGYLRGLTVTTHKGGIEELMRLDNSLRIHTEKRFIKNGHIYTSAGISAGIDMSLFMIGEYFGHELQEKTREYMEYY